MILAATIERLIRAEEHDRLLDAVLRNGRPIPLTARVRLSQPEAVEAAATGLALQRLCELAYSPDARIEQCAERLCALQEEAQGGFGAVGATGICVAALLQAIRWFEESGAAVSPALLHRMEAAADRGLHHLFSIQACFDGGMGLIGDEIDTAIALWQLGDLERARATIDLTRAERALAEDASGIEPAVAALLSLGRAGILTVDRIAA